MSFGTFPADDFTDWLGAACMSARDPDFGPPLRDVTADDFANFPIPSILALAMDEGQPQRTRIVALEALRIAFDRFLAEQRAEADRKALDPEHQARMAALMVEIVNNFQRLPAAA